MKRTSLCPPGRFVFVMDGAIQARSAAQGQPSMLDLHADSYVYFPAGECHTLRSRSGAGLLVFERRYALGAAAPEQAPPERQWGSVSDRPVLPVPGEVFLLRKLLPQTPNYDFNVHIMDFAPGEFLNVKEVHYNQHGLLLLAGQGLYRLADAWYPVQSGDAIWMAPYVVQWYAALGAHPSRYILYKDTTLDPGLYRAAFSLIHFARHCPVLPSANVWTLTLESTDGSVASDNLCVGD